ncbi:MAG: hypothetical protein M3P06_05170 [Acidobacteriota bacterium]|nr:hypothetical protein [Acidobacteriota bacterium]
MWIFTRSGFASIVEHRDDHSNVLIRARVQRDLQGILERYVDRPCSVISNEGTDYPFRAVISKDKLRQLLHRSVDDLVYDNFKAAIRTSEGDDRGVRSEIYGNVWAELLGLEELNG